MLDEKTLLKIQEWYDDRNNNYESKVMAAKYSGVLLTEVKRLRENVNKILLIAETNLALEWGDTDPSFEWGYIVDMIKGWSE